MDKSLLSQVLYSHDQSNIVSIQSVSGGCINQAFKITTQQNSFFIKINSPDKLSMFEQEAMGLEKFKAFPLRTPKVIDHGTIDYHFSYLTLEWVDLISPSLACQVKLGHKLGLLHDMSRCDTFGFEIDNTIGATPQPNPPSKDWLDFFQINRLGFQRHLIQQQFNDEACDKAIEKVIDHLPALFQAITVKASLLHGDLWSGNWAMDQSGEPIIYDPAPFYGHHEYDFAILEMFGSPPKEFYDAYQKVMPLMPGFEQRLKVYQLYHYLNHYNLFGRQYRLQCLHLAKEIISG